MPDIGPRCHELRVRDEGQSWRIVYRFDTDAIVIIAVFAETTQQTPKHVILDCQRRLKALDGVTKESLVERIAVDAKKREALEAAGWKIGDAAEFLGLTEEERQMIEFRLMVGRGVRRLRESNQLTQQELADRIGSSQSRVAKIEASSNEVSLDLMLRGFFSAGGRLAELIPPRTASEPGVAGLERGRTMGDPS